MATGRGEIVAEIDLGDEGVMLVIADWNPDPDVLEAEIVNIANSFDDWSVPLEEAKQVMIEATRGYFDRQEDPYGNPWPELNDDYAASKERLGYPPDILVREDRLKPYATSEDAWFIDERTRSIYFNVAGLPKSKKGFPYGAAHQSGTISEERRALFTQLGQGGLTAEQVNQLFEESGRGKSLPQRMFVGASDEVVAEIEAIFLKHLQDTVEEPWPGFGGAGGSLPGDIVITTTGLSGIFTGIPAGKTGGFFVRGVGGRFIGRTSG